MLAGRNVGPLANRVQPGAHSAVAGRGPVVEDYSALDLFALFNDRRGDRGAGDRRRDHEDISTRGETGGPVVPVRIGSQRAAVIGVLAEQGDFGEGNGIVSSVGHRSIEDFLALGG